MEYKKLRWESKYEAFENGGIDNEIKALKERKAQLVQNMMQAFNDNKNDELEEMKKEMEKLQEDLDKKEESKKTINANKGKIQNILQLKEDLVSESADLLEKLDIFATYEKIKQKVDANNKKMAQLEAEIVGIEAEIEALDKKINNPAVEAKDKKNFEKEKEKLQGKQQQKKADYGKLNNEDYVLDQNTLDDLEAKVRGYDVKTIKKTLLKNEKLIAKCDLIGINLIQGKSMEEITASLENFKFKNNKDFSKKIVSMREYKEKQIQEKEDEAQGLRAEQSEQYQRIRGIYEDYMQKVGKVDELQQKLDEFNAMPAPVLPWYKRIPMLKNVFSRNVNKQAEMTRSSMESELQAAIELMDRAKEVFMQERKKYETEQRRRVEQIGKLRKTAETLKEKSGRKVDYLSELRSEKNENKILSGMAIYGDSFKDRLKYQVPNVKSKLTKEQIKEARTSDRGKNKDSNYVGYRKEQIKKNIDDIKALKARKEAQQHEDDGR